MTVTDIQDELKNRFLTLNEFSGMQYITDSNVYLPNESFEEPEDKTFFRLSFMFNDAETLSVLDDDMQDRYTGIMQVDICTPLDTGTDEADEKYRWLCKLFRCGTTFDDVMITRTPSKSIEYKSDYFCSVIRIEFQADIDKE